MTPDRAAIERIVVDASVAAKWLHPEPGTPAAVALLEREDVELHAAELWIAELGNVLWKRVRRGELSGPDADEAVRLVLAMPVERHGHAALATTAMLLALVGGVTFYDAVYVALAQSLDALLVTADRPLAEAAERRGWPVRPLT